MARSPWSSAPTRRRWAHPGDEANYVHPEFGECHGSNKMAMPYLFEELADYNSRVSKGIVHTEEYQNYMRKLQEQFNRWSKEVW